MKPGDIITFSGAIQYIRSHLSQRGTIPDEKVAIGIVGLNASDHFEEWYKNADFAAILDEASDLEWSNGTPESLARGWRIIENSMKRLEEQYFQNR